MQAWVTPDDAPGDVICIKIYCPSGSEYEAALRGAVLSLGEAENWEQVGTQTVETVAGAFFDAYDETLVWEVCMPVGIVQWFAGDTLPDGYLWCDGASYSTTGIHADLFDAIGYVFGGSGGTFSVPNLEDRFVSGIAGGAGLGDTGGESAVTLSVAEIPAHTHTIPNRLTAVHDVPVGPAPLLIPNPIPTATGSTGGDGSHENKPPFVKLHSMVRYLR